MKDRLVRKFKHAFNGMWEGVKTDKSIQVQFMFAIIANITAYILQFGQIEWIIVNILCAIVISLEYINSAIEELCDLYSKTYHPHIKKIKDYSSAAVLVASIIALIIGLLIVIKHI